ncbi:MAG: hypothetical protein NW208_13185 [Bryobacter sp.]|nr:hypothetical protein [Bryobacter sp.]
MRLPQTVYALIFLLLLTLLAACQSAPTPLTIPPKVEGGWRQESAEALDTSKRPEWMERLGVKDARLVRYTGPTDVQVMWFQMSSSAAALECTQLWKRSPAQSVMMKENYFLVLESNHPNRETLMDFSRGLERAL